MPAFIIKPVQYNPRHQRWEACPADRAPAFAVVERTPDGESPVGYAPTREDADRIRNDVRMQRQQ